MHSTFLKCITLFFLMLIWSIQSYSQHNPNTLLHPTNSITAPQFTDIKTIDNANQEEHYFIIEELILGQTYQLNSSNDGDYFTISDSNDPFIIIDEGATPLAFKIPLNTGPKVVAVHLNPASDRSAKSLNSTTTISCLSCTNALVGDARVNVRGKILLADDDYPAKAGMIRFNNENKLFEGYNGTNWVSLSNESSTGGQSWGNPTEPEHEREQHQASDWEASDNFGGSVSISGDYALVSSYLHDTNGNSNQGKVYVFYRSNDTWSEQDILIASDGEAGDYFGRSVSISGDYAIVGAPNHNTNGVNKQGKAYIFHRSGTNWSQQAILSASDGEEFIEFGIDVAISGDYAIAGSQNDGDEFGKAYIFIRTGTSWTEQAILIASDEAAVSWSNVAISVDYAVVGVPFFDVNENDNQGKVYIFHRIGSSWVEETTIIASDGAAGHKFGESVSISGDYIAVGSSHHNTNGNISQGKAYIFRRSGSNWIQQDILTAFDGETGDRFGIDVSISDNYVIVGASYHDTNGVSQKGKAYVFNRSGTQWLQQAVLISSNANAKRFGQYVSISGDNIIVGSNEMNAVYFFY